MRSTVEKFENSCKVEKVIVKEKKGTIKEIENKIKALEVDPTDGSHAKSLLYQKNNDIVHLNK